MEQQIVILQNINTLNVDYAYKRKKELLCGRQANLCPDNWIDKRPDRYDRHSTRHSAIVQYLQLTASIPISQGLSQ